MSKREFPGTIRAGAAVAALMVGAVTLSGCSGLGAFTDRTTTGSVTQSAAGTLNQPMPASLGAPGSVQVAEGRFLPPANVGGGAPVAVQSTTLAPLGSLPPGPGATVFAQDLPALVTTSPSTIPGNTQAMPAQQTLAPLAAQTQAALGAPPSVLGTLPTNSAIPQVAGAAAAAGTYTHVIQSGESLYSIARRYDVTTQSLVHANALSSPDRIVVGQRIIIPGRSDLLGASAPAVTEAATASPIMPAPVPQQNTAALADARVLESAQTPATAAPAAAPAAEPVMSGANRFRWPATGRVITDFAASKGTGINIEVPEGTPVRAAENGTVIYTGSGVEGYGNLVLIRHPNGYVSAYAHLQSISVAKDAVVGRGDVIGAAGMTGSVSRPQLHFELRRGATPVDPVPLLAS